MNQTKHSPIRWDISSAAREFSLHHQALTKRLVLAGELPDGEGRYTTKQIADAIFTQSPDSRRRRIRQEAEEIALESGAALADRIENILMFSSGWMAGAKKVVREASISDEARQHILAAMQHIDCDEHFKENAAPPNDKAEGFER